MIGANAVQWVLTGLIVALCAAYAVKVLLPRSARVALAAWLARRGFASAAARLDTGGSGCDACAGAAKRTQR